MVVNVSRSFFSVFVFLCLHNQYLNICAPSPLVGQREPLQHRDGGAEYDGASSPRRELAATRGSQTLAIIITRPRHVLPL